MLQGLLSVVHLAIWRLQACSKYRVEVSAEALLGGVMLWQMVYLRSLKTLCANVNDKLTSLFSCLKPPTTFRFFAAPTENTERRWMLAQFFDGDVHRRNLTEAERVISYITGMRFNNKSGTQEFECLDSVDAFWHFISMSQTLGFWTTARAPHLKETAYCKSWFRFTGRCLLLHRAVRDIRENNK